MTRWHNTTRRHIYKQKHTDFTTVQATSAVTPEERNTNRDGIGFSREMSRFHTVEGRKETMNMQRTQTNHSHSTSWLSRIGRLILLCTYASKYLQCHFVHSAKSA